MVICLNCKKTTDKVVKGLCDSCRVYKRQKELNNKGFCSCGNKLDLKNIKTRCSICNDLNNIRFIKWYELKHIDEQIFGFKPEFYEQTTKHFERLFKNG
jgi:hypothetical protein